MFITLAYFHFRLGGGNQTPLGRMNVYLGGTLQNVLGPGDGAGGGEGGGRGGRGAKGAEINELELRHGWLDR